MSIVVFKINMKTIGQIIKDARVYKNYTPQFLEDETKIKSGFIDAIEKENWDVLPAFPTVLGFVKSLSTALEIDEKMAVAVLKRDYPPKKLTINPKPDVSSKFIWSPRRTFFAGIALVIAALLGYLGFQYYRFISPPVISIESPKNNQVVTGDGVLVFGSTDSDVKLTVNNQPVIVGNDGHFSVEIPVAEGTKEISIVGTNRSGKSTTIRRTIKVE